MGLSEHTRSLVIVALAVVDGDLAIGVVVVGVGGLAHLGEVEAVVVLDAEKLRQVAYELALDVLDSIADGVGEVAEQAAQNVAETLGDACRIVRRREAGKAGDEAPAAVAVAVPVVRVVRRLDPDDVLPDL